MLNRLPRYFGPPVIEGDEEKTRVAALINIILLSQIVIAVLVGLVGLFILPDSYAIWIVLVITLALRHVVVAILRRGYVRQVSIALSIIYWTAVTSLVYLSGGMQGPHLLTFITTVLVIGLLLGGRTGIWVATLSIGATLMIAYLGALDQLPATSLQVSRASPVLWNFFMWCILSANLVTVATFQYIAWSGLHRALAQARQMAQESAEANAYKSRLLARVSHELRNPMGAIMGLTEMLHYETRGPLTDEQHELTQRIINNADYLRRLVSELLEQARVEGGQLKVTQVKFSPVSLANKVTSALGTLAQTKGLDLNVEVADYFPTSLRGDPDRLEQILFNLAGNAIKFTEKGSVTFRLNRPDPAHWSIQVVDTGMGIPHEAQARVFEPFWQMNQSSTRKYGGVGLGLSIVKHLVELMKGQITVESEVGRGSTFTILLPFSEEIS